jgi:hypothetical protein
MHNNDIICKNFQGGELEWEMGVTEVSTLVAVTVQYCIYIGDLLALVA